jgi:hypothetical protein
VDLKAVHKVDLKVDLNVVLKEAIKARVQVDPRVVAKVVLLLLLVRELRVAIRAVAEAWALVIQVHPGAAKAEVKAVHHVVARVECNPGFRPVNLFDLVFRT